MGQLGVFPQGSFSAINDQWERNSSEKFFAAFTDDCDANYVRSNLVYVSAIVINAPHPSDAGQVVSLISVTQVEEPSIFNDPTNGANTLIGTDCYWWQVEITYGPWDPLTHTITGNPVDQPIDFGFQWQVFEQPCDVAINSTGELVPVVNSVGLPYDPPVTREQLKGIMRIAYNSLSFVPSSFFAFGNLINSDTFNGFPPHTLKVSPPNMPQRLYSQFLDENYYRLELEIAFNPNDNGWDAMPIDRSFLIYNGSQLVKILDINGQPISEPALLNGSGGLATSGTFYQFDYTVYTPVSFATTFPNLVSLF
jgi:hypothetical protein